MTLDDGQTWHTESILRKGAIFGIWLIWDFRIWLIWDFKIWLIWVFGKVEFSEFTYVEFLPILIKVNSAEG